MTTPDPVLGTVTADPTLGLLSHAIAVGMGALATYLSVHFAVDLSTSTQLELAGVVGTVVTSLAHYLQAAHNAKKVAQ